MKRFGIDLKGIEFDTMIAAHLLNPNARSYKLDNLSLAHLNYKMVPIKDLIGVGKNQITMDQVSLDDISFYAAEDADVVIELTEIFMKDLKKQKMNSNRNERKAREIYLVMFDFLYKFLVFNQSLRLYFLK